MLSSFGEKNTAAESEQEGASDCCSTNSSTDESSFLLVPPSSPEELPIDMQFNSGNVLAITGYSILLVLSAVANISVMVLICRVRRQLGRWTTMNLLLWHLTIADLVVTFFTMPLEIAWNATVSWLAGDLLCRFLSVTRIFGLYLSSFLLMCISVDRYHAVMNPLSTITWAPARTRRMLILAWAGSFIFSAPQALIFHVETHPIFQFYQQCVTFNSFPTPGLELAYNFFGFSFLYGIPFLTILVCYGCILAKISRINQHPPRNEGHLRRSTMGSFARAKGRTLQLSVLIVSTFLLCWTPYNVMCLWYWLDRHSASNVDQRVQKGLFLFACTNSCMNPLIYGCFHFRRHKHLVRPLGGVLQEYTNNMRRQSNDQRTISLTSTQEGV